MTTVPTSALAITSDDEFVEHINKIHDILESNPNKLSDLEKTKMDLLRSEWILIRDYIKNQMNLTAPSLDEGEKEQGGGKKRKSKSKSKKIKGGWAYLDMPRITNTEGVVNTKHNPENMDAAVEIGGHVHKAFTSGNITGFSSTDGMTADNLKFILPSYGTAIIGGANKKKSKK